MKNSELEERLADEIKDETPDMLDTLMSEITDSSAEASDAVPYTEAAASGQDASPDKITKAQVVHGGIEAAKTVSATLRLYRAVACIATVIALFLGARTVAQDKTFAVVGIDVNPSIEISINKSEHVVSAEALNEDGEKILDGMDLKGSDINTACNAVIGAMVLDGYLTEDVNSMLVSVQAADPEKGREIETGVSEKLSRFMENSEIAAAVMGQYVEDDEDIRDFADENDISTGKAWLIMKLLNTGSRHFTKESLLGISTQELILLGESRGIFDEDQHGKVNISKYIGEKKAVSAALKHAGVSRDEVSEISCEFDCDDGSIIYEVDFEIGGQEYDYEIDAETGEVISAEREDEDGEWSEVKNKSASDDDDDDDDDRYDRDDDDDHDDDRYDRDDDRDDDDDDDDDD